MPSALTLLPIVAPVVGGAAVVAWRVRETLTPVTIPKIGLPPVAMSTGFCMFLRPETRIPWALGVGAFLLGAVVLSGPLARSSTLERQGDVVVMRRSNGFLVILLGLLGLRLIPHDYIGHLLPPLQTGALLFVLAFGVILRWRVGMYQRFRARGR